MFENVLSEKWAISELQKNHGIRDDLKIKKINPWPLSCTEVR